MLLLRHSCSETTRGSDHGVAVIENDELRLSGAVSSLSAALADVTLIPSSDWHGHARLLPKSDGAWRRTASTTIELDVEGVQDAPQVIDEGGPYEVEEDTYLPLSIKLKIRTMIMRRTPRSRVHCERQLEAARCVFFGGKSVRGRRLVQYWRTEKASYSRARHRASPLHLPRIYERPDWHGDDTVDIVADDGGGFPRGDSLVATLSIPISVHAMDDALRITSPVLFDEASKGVALGRNGTKTETPIQGVSVYDPDSDVVSDVDSFARAKVIGHVKDVESDAGRSRPHHTKER